MGKKKKVSNDGIKISNKKKKKSGKKTSKWNRWIQKRKKKNRRKYIMAKPRLKKIFAKYVVIGLCIAICLCSVGTTVAVSYYRDTQDGLFNQRFDSMCDSIRETYNEKMELTSSEEDNMSLWKTNVRWNMNTRFAMFQDAAVLYDEGTRSVLVNADSVTNIFLIVDKDTEDRKSYQLECDREFMKEAREALDAEWKKYDPDGDGTYEGGVSPELRIADVYMKGGQFVPGKVKLIQQDESDESKDVVLKEFDYTPEDTSGYTHVVVEGDNTKKILGPVEWEIVDTEAANQILTDLIENDSPDDSIWDGDSASYNNKKMWGCESISYETIELEDGFEVKLIAAGNIDLFEDYGEWVVLAYIVVGLITVLMSFGVAYRNYMIRLNHYQLDVYRRETTNAMAHDLKTPLMAISGYAQNLKESVHTEKRDYYTDTILKNVQYMNEMIANILELAKVENVEWVLDKEEVNLKNVTEEVLKKYEILTVDNNLEILVEGEVIIQADIALITRMLENIIGNTIKYAAGDTQVQILMEKDFYEIRNIAAGELEVAAEELWKPFVKGDNSRNSQKGTGIGLTIVKNIAEAHGFELELQCEQGEFVTRITF